MALKSNTTKLTPILTKLKKLGFVPYDDYIKWSLRNGDTFARIIPKKDKTKTLVIYNYEKDFFLFISTDEDAAKYNNLETLGEILKNLI